MSARNSIGQDSVHLANISRLQATIAGESQGQELVTGATPSPQSREGETMLPANYLSAVSLLYIVQGQTWGLVLHLQWAR